VLEESLAVRLLGPADAPEPVDNDVVGELRDLRAGGSRWK
jgi:hypothetical protein